MNYLDILLVLIGPYLALIGVMLGHYATFGIPLTMLRTRAIHRREQLLKRQERMNRTGKAYPNAKKWFNGTMAAILLLQSIGIYSQGIDLNNFMHFVGFVFVIPGMLITSYVILRRAFYEIIAHEEKVKKEMLQASLDEVEEEIELLTNPKKWERSSYSNGKWTYTKRPISDAEKAD